MKYLWLLGLFLSGCGYHKEKEAVSFKSYADVNAQLFVPKCAQCHSEDVVASYDSVKLYASEIKRRVSLPAGDTARMPQSGSLTDSEIKMLVQWIEKGLPFSE